MTNTLQQTTLFSSNDFSLPAPERVSGNNWTILHGDVMHIVPRFEKSAFDAVITDPPYASGGASQTAKNRSTTEKYSSLRGEKALPDFDSDQMDQRSWTRWMCEWLQVVRAACKPGAPICLFIDWRQLPSMTDALQWAGWIWRGIAVWDKPSSRPQRGRFRQQAEFIVWGSNGKMPLERNVGCLPGVFRQANPANRIHVTEKPLQLMPTEIPDTPQKEPQKEEAPPVFPFPARRQTEPEPAPPSMPSSNSSEKSPPMWPGFHADQVRARGKRPSVRLELGEIRAILAARKEHSPMPRSPIRIHRDGPIRG